MQDHTTLKPGDKIRLLRVPEADVEQRRREIRHGSEGAGMTANAIEQIIQQAPVVTISHVDEHGHPWLECEWKRDDGTTEYHSLTIYDDESWERN